MIIDSHLARKIFLKDTNLSHSSFKLFIFGLIVIIDNAIYNILTIIIYTLNFNSKMESFVTRTNILTCIIININKTIYKC